MKGLVMIKDNKAASKLVVLGTARRKTKGSDGQLDEPVIGGRFG